MTRSNSHSARSAPGPRPPTQAAGTRPEGRRRLLLGVGDRQPGSRGRFGSFAVGVRKRKAWVGVKAGHPLYSTPSLISVSITHLSNRLFLELDFITLIRQFFRLLWPKHTSLPSAPRLFLSRERCLIASSVTTLHLGPLASTQKRKHEDNFQGQGSGLG